MSGDEFAQESVRFNMWMPRWMHKGLTNFSVLDGRDAADVVRQLISEWLVYKKNSVQYRGYSDRISDIENKEDA